MSPKCGVLMVKKNQEKNRKIELFDCSNLKVVDDPNLSNSSLQKDLNAWAETVCATDGYYLQPLSHEKSSITRCAKIITAQSLWKLSLQTHKVIGLK